MTGTQHGLEFSHEEIALLQRPESREVASVVSSCIASLSELLQRYTGSMFLVRILDEEEGAAMFRDQLARLERFPGLQRRLLEGFHAYERVRDLARELDLTDPVFEQANAAIAELREMWSWATRQPGYRAAEPTTPAGLRAAG